MSKPPDWWPLNPFHKSYWVQGELFYTGQDSYAAWQEGAYAIKLAIIERVETILSDADVICLPGWGKFKEELGL